MVTRKHRIESWADYLAEKIANAVMALAIVTAPNRRDFYIVGALFKAARRSEKAKSR